MHREFTHWLKSNAHQFSTPPIFSKSNAKNAEYNFIGVLKKITLYMDHSGQFMIISKKGNALDDIIYEFDVLIKKTSAGKYFCDFCISKHHRYYSSKRALLTSECFKPLIKWASANLIMGKSLLVLGERGWNCGKIMDTSAANKKRKHVKFIAPIINSEKSKKNEVNSGKKKK